LLLAASYAFYGCWDWRYLLLIGVSTLTDFLVGRQLGKIAGSTPAGKAQRRFWLFGSIAVNLSFLGLFKYFNFFSGSLAQLLGLLGVEADPFTLDVILPLGISFYTLKTISYTIDVYHNRLKPTNSLLDYAVFVAFFPQLLAGPIERAARLLPQIEHPRRVRTDQITTGLYLILWGYFKKLVIADNMAKIANQVFDHYTNYTGLDILLGILAFAVQIYGDFSGYSDIARGISRLMGFETIVNFKLPYFALRPADFWQRWHISLSEWLRDYIFFPLRRALLRRNRNGNSILNLVTPPMITLLASGLWHGAALHFVIWGAYHGVLLVLYQIRSRLAWHHWTGGNFSPMVTATKMALMFTLTLFGWLIFRASSIRQIGFMLSKMSLLPSAESASFASSLLFFTLPLLLIQVYQHITRDLLILTKLRYPARVFLYGLMLVWIVIFGARASTEFIYVQF
jgi:D-alanyl-lipoteichoic acid acyltransferase DltB (MBOAT superfamily)